MSYRSGLDDSHMTWGHDDGRLRWWVEKYDPKGGPTHRDACSFCLLINCRNGRMWLVIDPAGSSAMWTRPLYDTHQGYSRGHTQSLLKMKSIFVHSHRSPFPVRDKCVLCLYVSGVVRVMGGASLLTSGSLITFNQCQNKGFQDWYLCVVSYCSHLWIVWVPICSNTPNFTPFLHKQDPSKVVYRDWMLVEMVFVHKLALHWCKLNTIENMRG